MAQHKKHLRTWVEIDPARLRHNAGQFFGIIGAKPFLMAVVKSNAYGHGLVASALALGSDRTFRKRGWFGVDSIVEALRLRREGVTNPVLVLGYTLPARLGEAASGNIAVTVSSFDALRALSDSTPRPSFHIKIDTGMCRQGFFVKELPAVLAFLKKNALKPDGVFTHFSMAKDRGYPAHTEYQFMEFTRAIAQFKKAGFRNMIRHAAATGGALLFPETHLDMVRIGMGLYGYPPSSESVLNTGTPAYGLKPVAVKPVLSWKTIVSEVKVIPAGAAVGYDATERVSRPTRIAVLPIGYWHGFDRGLSGTGEVLIGGRRRRVLGRVSMDMIVVDASATPAPGVGDEVVLLGRQGSEEILAPEIGAKIGTSWYEYLTRINPLIKRVLK